MGTAFYFLFLCRNTFVVRKFLLNIFLLSASCIQAKAQNNFLGTWSVLNTEYALNKKTSVWAEGQTRSQKFYNDFFYHEMKTGISIRPNKSIGILLGIGQYATYSNGGNFKTPVVSHEFRLWEQLTLVNNIGIVKIEHRYRIEQRWRNDEYRNRFRYRFNPIIPINKKSIENKALFATLYDEIFITNQAFYFERNRFFAGMGYQLNKRLTLQAGWLRQSDYTALSSSSKDFLQTTLLIKFNNQNNPTEAHPSSMD